MSYQFDLNLVRTFVLLYETRSVTAAADALGVTQPTVSYSLGKLRRQLKDDLFLRSPQGLAPTSEAERLYPSLSAAMADVGAALGAAAEFDPARPSKFSLGLSDLGEVTILPPLVEELDLRAPAATLQVRAFDIDTAVDQLARGEIDAVVASPMLDSPRLTRTPLFTEGYVGMASTQHPRLHADTAASEELRIERFVVVDGASGHPGPREALRVQDLEHRIALRVTRFATLPYIVQDSQLVAIVPERVARTLARTHPVRTFTLPWSIESVEVAAYTRRAPGRSAAQSWFLNIIRTALQGFPSI